MELYQLIFVILSTVFIPQLIYYIIKDKILYMLVLVLPS